MDRRQALPDYPPPFFPPSFFSPAGKCGHVGTLRGFGERLHPLREQVQAGGVRIIPINGADVGDAG